MTPVVSDVRGYDREADVHGDENIVRLQI
jgi:hypothetical protein